jgi:hypothetical protein
VYIFVPSFVHFWFVARLDAALTAGDGARRRPHRPPLRSGLAQFSPFSPVRYLERKSSKSANSPISPIPITLYQALTQIKIGVRRFFNSRHSTWWLRNWNFSGAWNLVLGVLRRLDSRPSTPAGASPTIQAVEQ